MFDGLHSPEDVKAVYEAFWNDLDPYTREIVRVLRVRRMGR